MTAKEICEKWLSIDGIKSHKAYEDLAELMEEEIIEYAKQKIIEHIDSDCDCGDNTTGWTTEYVCNICGRKQPNHE